MTLRVTPLVGVWIEMIVDSGYYILAVKSLPLVGVWIEIKIN